MKFNFYPREVVPRYRDPQLQVTKNYLEFLINLSYESICAPDLKDFSRYTSAEKTYRCSALWVKFFSIQHFRLEIYRAAGEDDLTSLDALLNEPADPERQAFVNMSLVRTCAMEHSKCPELLLQHGANPNTIILGGGELIRQAASDGLPTALLVAWFEYCCQMPGLVSLRCIFTLCT